jgi:hypothetical protein
VPLSPRLPRGKPGPCKPTTVLYCTVLLPAVSLGGDDGGIHAWQLPQLAAAVAALGQAKQSAAAAAALSLVAMPGHAAAVLGLDYCSTTHQLASAAEVSSDFSWSW